MRKGNTEKSLMTGSVGAKNTQARIIKEISLIDMKRANDSTMSIG